MKCLPHPKMSDSPAYTRLQLLLEAIIACIAQNTPRPDIDHFPNEAIIQFAVDPRDQGRIVGKKGCTIWAIQVLMWYAGLTQLSCAYKTKLLDPEAPCKGHSRPFRFNKNYDREKMSVLAESIVETCIPKHATVSFQEPDSTTLVVNLKIEKYLQTPITDPSFVEAFESVMRAAGMSNGATIKTEATFI